MNEAPGNGADAPRPPKAVIQIILTDEGQIIINGPIEDKIMFAGLLEIAKQRMFDHHREKPASNIIPIRRPQ